jgi:hypothetical protein
MPRFNRVVHQVRCPIAHLSGLTSHRQRIYLFIWDALAVDSGRRQPFAELTQSTESHSFATAKAKADHKRERDAALEAEKVKVSLMKANREKLRGTTVLSQQSGGGDSAGEDDAHRRRQQRRLLQQVQAALEAPRTSQFGELTMATLPADRCLPSTDSREQLAQDACVRACVWWRRRLRVTTTSALLLGGLELPALNSPKWWPRTRSTSAVCLRACRAAASWC